VLPRQVERPSNGGQLVDRRGADAEGWLLGGGAMNSLLPRKPDAGASGQQGEVREKVDKVSEKDRRREIAHRTDSKSISFLCFFFFFFCCYFSFCPVCLKYCSKL